ncbi:tyrosine-type recombinase/integrase [Isoptericola sp. NPDC055881]
MLRARSRCCARSRQRRHAPGSRRATSGADKGHVFTTDLGRPLDPRNALRALTTAAKRSGLEDVGLHTLRHTAASLMLSSGVGLKVVSDVLGHASITVTADTYGHLQPDVTKAAMATLDAALNGRPRAV